MNDKFDISAIIIGHAEGALLEKSFASLVDACEHAEALNVSTEIILCLDKPTESTSAVANALPHSNYSLQIYSFGDQGLVRNTAVKTAQGETIAFLDGDDLWSYNWLSRAWEAYLESGRKAVIHPEINWFFEENDNIFIHMDQRDHRFDSEFLRIGNYWDALCLANRQIFLDTPYLKRELTKGFAYEDWNWNNKTFSQGVPHHVAPDTIHFKRRRKNSQHAKASARNVLPRPSRLNLYSFWD